MVKVPECRDGREDCVFEFGTEGSTLMYFPPQYDKNGVNTNPDRNYHTGDVSCLACGKRWKFSHRADEPRDFELTNEPASGSYATGKTIYNNDNISED